MISSQQNEAKLKDSPIDIKIKLSALWAAAMLCYIYCDLLEFFKPGHIDTILKGNMGVMGPTTELLMLTAAVMMAIPCIMVVLSLILKPIINRWTNIILGCFFTALMIATMFMGPWYYYIYFGTVEIIITSLIVWYSWNWPKVSNEI